MALVPLWERPLLTEDEDCDFVFWIGNKRMLKRKEQDAYIEKTYSV